MKTEIEKAKCIEIEEGLKSNSVKSEPVEQQEDIWREIFACIESLSTYPGSTIDILKSKYTITRKK